jgi:hypothetical protein
MDPRKGLEYVVQAMPEIVARHADALYLIVGQTHPELLKRDGETYRESVAEVARRVHDEPHLRHEVVEKMLRVALSVENIESTKTYPEFARAAREGLDERTGRELLLRLRERRLRRDIEAEPDLARVKDQQAALARVRQAIAELA